MVAFFKTAWVHYLALLLLCVSIFLPWGIGLLLPVITLALACSVRHLRPWRNTMLLWTSLALIAGISVRLYEPEQVRGLGLLEQDILSIRANLVSDAVQNRQGQAELRLRLERVFARDGAEASAQGLLACVIDYDFQTGDDSLALYRGATVDIAFTAPLNRRFAVQRGQMVKSQAPQGIDYWRASFLNFLGQSEVLDPTLPAGGLFQALALGRQDLLDPAMAVAFRASGCSHVVALSGMHLSALAGLLIMLLVPVIGRRWASFPAMLIATAFVWLAGPYPSVVRALAFFLLYGLMRHYRSSTPLDQVFVLSTLLVLIVMPALGTSAGFWLSCGALAGLFLGVPPCESFLKPLVRHFFAVNLAAGLSASLGALPFMLVYQLPFYPQGIVAGICLGPASLAYLLAGLVILVLEPVLGPIGFPLELLAQAMDYFYQGLLALARLFVWY